MKTHPHPTGLRDGTQAGTQAVATRKSQSVKGMIRKMAAYEEALFTLYDLITLFRGAIVVLAAETNSHKTTCPSNRRTADAADDCEVGSKYKLHLRRE